MPYLVDVIAVKELGRRITDARFEAWKQGVVARDAWVGVTYPQEGCVFQVERPRLSEGWQSFWRILSSQDLTDKSKWSEPIDDPDAYFRTVFRA